MKYPSVEQQIADLERQTFEAKRKYRIVFVGRFSQGPTGIVSSLHRALEGLGHTVFALEPALHTNAFDQSSGAQGGYGPIFFHPEQVSPIFEEFKPEIIIFCAGGVVLNSDGKEYFHQKGIISIGLTLSDPDVQDSIIEWVGNFDYHATNAQLAYDKYLDHGHLNTFLMPFGIDKEYILRKVSPVPDLQADAICIGHATGREDRHAVMSHLADHMNVKVYGEGWPLPSETVSGDRLLQAAHAGTFHINFPATRAGFTNVKCGVFEAIGAGGILCTSEFNEMKNLFEYGTEIIGYRSPEDLSQQIIELKADPVRMEAIRRRGFARLLSEHLYEHRWEQLFEKVELDLRSINGSKDASEIERISGILRRTHGRPRNVVISGFYGARNRGDDLLLRVITHRLKENDSDTNIIVAAVHAREVEASSGLQAFTRTDLHQSEKFASAATATILGPGGLWHDYTIARAGGVTGVFSGAVVSPAHLAQLPLMTKAYGGQFHIFGMGVGPLSDEAARAVVRLTGAHADSVTVRDGASLDLLNGLTDTWQAAPTVAPDVVYALDLSRNGQQLDLPANFIVLNVRKWSGDPEAHNQIRNKILSLAESLNLPVVGLPMQPTDVDALVGENEEFRDEFFSVLPTDAPLEHFLEVLDRATLTVSMRLHSNLLSHRVGTPAVGFAYDPKVQSHFEELGLDKFVLQLDAKADDIELAIVNALKADGLSVNAMMRVRQLEDKANDALNKMVRTITQADRLESPIAGMVHRPENPERAVPSGDSAKTPEVITVFGAGFRDSKRPSIKSGNLEMPSREVSFENKKTSSGYQFGFKLRAPIRGDFVEWLIPIEALDEKGFRIELWIKQKYGEQRDMRGFMEYQVLIDDTLLFHQDIADWNPRNSVWIVKRYLGEEAVVRVRLMTLRNCPDWNWGQATTMAIERVQILPWNPSVDLAWGASSPFAKSDAVRFQMLESSGSSTSSKKRFPWIVRTKWAKDALATNLARPLKKFLKQ